jgi:hypothetical protein
MQGEQPATCGEGLAANAVVPEKVGAFVGAMAELLQNHTRALDGRDSNARLEREAYEDLIEQLRAIASGLGTLAAAMRGYRDLPAAPHDERLLADQRSNDVFTAFIGAEEALLGQLRKGVDSHRAMLSAMGPAKLNE